jgi:hypothetical protein
MKHTLMNIITLLFIGFLFIGVIGMSQSIIQDFRQKFFHEDTQDHVLAYQKR